MVYSGYNGKPRIAHVYTLLQEGRTARYLRDEGFGDDEITKAVTFRDKYQNRDIFPSILAKELDIPMSTARRLKESAKSRIQNSQNMEGITCR
jgi:hypothetical protein